MLCIPNWMSSMFNETTYLKSKFSFLPKITITSSFYSCSMGNYRQPSVLGHLWPSRNLFEPFKNAIIFSIPTARRSEPVGNKLILSQNDMMNHFSCSFYWWLIPGPPTGKIPQCQRAILEYSLHSIVPSCTQTKYLFATATTTNYSSQKSSSS